MSVVIIPAYKPDEALVSIVRGLKSCCRIVVVDDGSGSEYEEIFKSIEQDAAVLHHTENKGKGAAIKTALAYIEEGLPMEPVIGIMDADGQHLPEDMLKILRFSEAHSSCLTLGVRVVGRDMPFRSRMGNAITRGIFHLVSGVRVSDTQTGLRAFGRELLPQMRAVRGERYEYEMNVLLDMARSKVPIKEVPIRTIYRDEQNSTSHFRVVRDSLRIYKDLLKFTMISFSSFVLDYFLFNLLLLFFPAGAGFVLTANIAARLVSAFYNYSANCRFVFHTRRQLRTAADYFALAGLILVLNNLILEGLMSFLSLPAYLAKLITECILFLISWLVQNKMIFKKKDMRRPGREIKKLGAKKEMEA